MELSSFPAVTLIMRDTADRVAHLVFESIVEHDLPIAVEITRFSAAFERVGDFARRYPTVPIGAGTILDVGSAQAARDVGAQFLLSPSLMSPDLIDYAHSQRMLVVSGAYSPSEIYEAYDRGSDIVKVFPIRDLGAMYIPDVLAPRPGIPIMAVGGVDPVNAALFRERGIEYIGVGTGVFGRAVPSADDVSRALIALSTAMRPDC